MASSGNFLKYPIGYVDPATGRVWRGAYGWVQPPVSAAIDAGLAAYAAAPASSSIAGSSLDVVGINADGSVMTPDQKLGAAVVGAESANNFTDKVVAPAVLTFIAVMAGGAVLGPEAGAAAPEAGAGTATATATAPEVITPAADTALDFGDFGIDATSDSAAAGTATAAAPEVVTPQALDLGNFGIDATSDSAAAGPAALAAPEVITPAVEGSSVEQAAQKLGGSLLSKLLSGALAQKKTRQRRVLPASLFPTPRRSRWPLVPVPVFWWSRSARSPCF